MIKLARQWFFLLAFLLVACRAGGDPPSPEVLDQRLQGYYELEQRGDWKGTYAFRTPAYRRNVSIDLYVSRMQKDNTGWQLIKYSVDSKEFRSGKMYFRMTFIEAPPSDYLRGRVPPEARPKTVETVDESVWVYLENTWFLYSSGSRGRLTLSDAVGS